MLALRRGRCEIAVKALAVVVLQLVRAEEMEAVLVREETLVVAVEAEVAAAEMVDSELDSDMQLVYLEQAADAEAGHAEEVHAEAGGAEAVDS